MTNQDNPSREGPLIAASENVETDQAVEVSCQVDASLSPSVHDDATNSEAMAVDQPAISVVEAVDKSQIVATATSAIDSDATDADDIELDQHITTETTDTAPVFASSPSIINGGAIIANHEEATIPITIISQNFQSANQNGENTCKKLMLTPEAIRPYPKAAPRSGRKGRKKGSTRILTDTPEKCEIEAAYLERMKRKPPTLKLGKRGKSTPKNTSKNSKKKKTIRNNESDSESDGNISLHDDSDLDVSDGRSDSDAIVDAGDSVESLKNENLNNCDCIGEMLLY